MLRADPARRQRSHYRLIAAQAHYDILAAHDWSLGLDDPASAEAQHLARIAEGPDPARFHRSFLTWRASLPPRTPPTTQVAMTVRFTSDWLTYVGLDIARSNP